MAQEFAKAFYNSTQWRKCRAAYAASVDYVCEICGEPGDIVHHTVRLTPENINDPYITLNWSLLKLTCITCHNKVYNEAAVAEGLTFDEHGNLVPAPPGVRKRGRPKETECPPSKKHAGSCVRGVGQKGV